MNFLCSLVLAIILVTFGFLPEVALANWPVRRADSRNSGWLPLAGPRELKPKWQALNKLPVATFVGIGNNGALYTLTMDGGACHLYALDKNGKVRWCSDRVQAASSSVAVSEDDAVFVIDGKNLFRFESDGKLTWKVPVSDGASALMFTKQNYVIVADLRGLIAVYNPRTGERVAKPYQLPAARSPARAIPDSLKLGLGLIGIEPTYINDFFQEFFGFNVVIKDAVAVHPLTGRIFTKGADSTGKSGMLYALDFIPPANGSSGEIKLACTGSIGLGSDTSPSISADGLHVYVTDGTGTLYALNTNDCRIAWSLKVPGAAPAAATVGLNGYLYSLTSGKLTAFQDQGSSGEMLWQTDITERAKADGFTAGVFDSAITLTQNYLYATASFGRRAKENPQDSSSRETLVTQASRLVAIDPTNGNIVSVTPLGDESDSTPSLSENGTLYVPSKPLRKAVGLGLKKQGLLQPDFSIPEAQAGVYAFEPASFKQLAVDGFAVASRFAEQAVESLNQGNTNDTITGVERSIRQLKVVSENITTAQERGEVVLKTANQTNQDVQTVNFKLNQVLEQLKKEHPDRQVKSLLKSSQKDINRALKGFTQD